ncbi:MAG: hypothetical protein ACYSSO_10685 [Planctomycetota bacterium]|jgi:ribosomal protein L37AE/L43A
MSKFICPKCDMDCGTWLALDKHKKKGCAPVEVKEPEELFQFYSRFEKLNEKCPKCNDIFVDFWKITERMWVCLKCRTVFVPKSVMGGVLEYKEKKVAEEREIRKAAGSQGS